MKKIYVLALVSLLMLMVVAAGLQRAGVSKIGGSQQSKEYLRNKGFIILSCEGSSKYTLTNDPKLLYVQNWRALRVKPDKYFGKVITTEGFIVANHPLKGRVKVWVVKNEDNVIGGYSLPVRELDRAGGTYDIDGN